MNIFLSYAEEDREIASTIAARLDDAGHNIFNWLDPAQRGKRIRLQVEEGMKSAQAFIALLSSSYRRSYWCGQELDIAINIDRETHTRNPNATFIHVVARAGIPPAEAGVLGSYDWIYMTRQDEWETALTHLVTRFDAADGDGPLPVMTPEDSSAAVDGKQGNAAPQAASQGSGKPVFRNRDEELHRVLSGLTNTAGPHFWYVVAPPQLGKTWFLKHIGAHPDLSGPEPWVVRQVDLREQKPEVLGDLPALLALLFGQTAPPGEETLRIAQEILRSRRPHLCLLDCAELLTAEASGALRTSLSQIYGYVQERGAKGIRMAFIAASRRDSDWKGITPQRFAPLPLSEFNRDVVQQALHDLSVEMEANISATMIRENAARVHRVTEGLPALLVRCLQWVRREQWLEMERLDTQEQFEKFAANYLQEALLAPASLLPQERGGDDGRLGALIQACRVLAPYRLFTVSHLRHHHDKDSDFRAALDAASWTLDDLWSAISATALLKRPLNEAWKEIHPAIRRLFFRYFYRSDDQRAEAHIEARKFVENWSDALSATDQVVGLVECLWHEAVALGLREPAATGGQLTESARALSRALRTTPGFTLPELRDFAAERMRNDGELEESVGNGDGLLSRLVAIVRDPEASAT